MDQTGYDSSGPEEYSRNLSQRRADAVRMALMKHGIAAGRIRSYDEEYPVATNNTATGRQQNHRVEVIISDESGAIPERGN